MSMVALLGAVKQNLQSLLGVTPGVDTGDIFCDVTDEGQPKPNSGQVFFGIVGVGMSNASEQALDEYYDFDVVVTLRAGYVPEDRIGNQLILLALSSPLVGGLWALTEEVRAGWESGSYGLHMNYHVLDLAGGTTGNVTWTGGNAYSLPNTVNGFIEPPVFLRAQYLGAKGPDWFYAEGADPATTGVACKLSFGKARRVQVIESSS